MGRNSGGYTIIEVMIVLAITGLLFASAVLVFQGEQGRTGFSQAMQDLNSKIQNYSSQVLSGNDFDNESFDCALSSGQPVLSNGSGNNSGCVFLGQAIHVQQNDPTFSIYTVLGNNTGTTLATADPAPAVVSNSFVLNDHYTLENGAQILSSKSGNREYELMGLYNGLPASAGNNVTLMAYPCNTGSCDRDNPGINAISHCVELNPSCGPSTAVNQWILCVKGGDGETAQLIVNTTSVGLSTKLNYASCN